jgi:hypothetical protein
MFRLMWLSSGVKIIGGGNCCLLLFLMLLIYKFPRSTYVFLLVGCVLSCVLCNRMPKYNTILWKQAIAAMYPACVILIYILKSKVFFLSRKVQNIIHDIRSVWTLVNVWALFSHMMAQFVCSEYTKFTDRGMNFLFVINMIVPVKFASRTYPLLT